MRTLNQIVIYKNKADPCSSDHLFWRKLHSESISCVKLNVLRHHLDTHWHTKIHLVTSRFTSVPVVKIGHHPMGCMWVFVCVRANVTLISFTPVLCFKMVGSLPLSGLARLFRTCLIIRKWAWPCPYKIKLAWWGNVYVLKGGAWCFSWPWNVTTEKLPALLPRPQRYFIFAHLSVFLEWLLCMCDNIEC